MFVSDCLTINAIGHLTIGGIDTVSLAQQYGTPLYIMDEEQIRRNCRKYKSSIERFYNGNGLAAYASKAMCCKAVCRVAMEEGLGLDVVSAGELHTAASVGFPPERIYFHGNNKTPEELSEALRYGVGHIVVDNLAELGLLNSLAKSCGKRPGIFLRIKPGIDAHTHEFIRTGQIDSKFGLALETGEAMEAVETALRCSHLQLEGIHCHIGSQIFDIEPFELAAEVMLGLIADIKEKTGVELRQLNLGGGFGIKYVPEHEPAEYDSYMERVSAVVHRVCTAKRLMVPFIIIEPGRSIVGNSGITLYTVGAVKEIPGVRTYVSVDGGMTDNPRYALYKSEYHAILANKAGEQRSMPVTLAGKCCESGDLLGEGLLIQPVHVGDTLAVLATGAYNYSMASNYNRLPKPPVVFVNHGTSRTVIRRESLDDLLRNDLD